MKQQDIVLANKNQNLATFIVKPANKATSANLDKFVFTFDNFDSLLNSAAYKDLNAEDLFEVLIGENEKEEKANNVDFVLATIAA
jgi:ADP-glucose pyrophosphorylase